MNSAQGVFMAAAALAVLAFIGCGGGTAGADGGSDASRDTGVPDAGWDGGAPCDDGGCPFDFHCGEDVGICIAGCLTDSDCEKFKECEISTGKCVDKAPEASIEIDPSKVVSEASPLQNGAVIEVERNGTGVWAEMLGDRGFEWTRPYVDDQGIDPWSLFSDKDVGASWEWVTTPVFQGTHSMKVSLTKSYSGRYAGIRQTNLAISKERGGQKAYYTLTFMMWNDGNAPSVLKAELTDPDHSGSGGSPTIAGPIDIIPDKALNVWKQYEVTFSPRYDSKSATLSIKIPDQSWVWLDAFSMMPADVNVETNKKWWPEIEAALKGGKVNMIGLSGTSADAYNWRDGVGSRDFRPVSVPALACSTLDPDCVLEKTPYYNDFGTHEFLDFCAAVGAEPLITVSFKLGPQAAANWVEYVNVVSPGKQRGIDNGWKVDSYTATDAAPDGYFAWLRDMFGRTLPWKVTYWEIGNELWNEALPEPGSIPGPNNLKNYSDALPVFAELMKGKDPSVKVIGDAGPIPPATGTDYRTKWNQTVLEKAGASIDYLSPHFYAPGDIDPKGDPEEVFYRIAGFGPFYLPALDVVEQAITASGYNLGMAITGYGVWTGVRKFKDPCGINMMRGVIGAASLRNGNLAGPASLANLYSLLGTPTGLLQWEGNAGGALVTTGGFLLNNLYRDRALPGVVDCDVVSPRYTAQLWTYPDMVADVIDVVPAIDASGNTLSVMIANRHYGDKPMLARIGTKAFSSSKGRAYVLSGADPTACNTALTPDAIKMTEAVVKVGGEYALFEIPPYSVSAVILEK